MVAEKTLRERGLYKQFAFPFVLTILVFLFLFFETEILGFLGIAPFNQIVLFIVLGVVFLTKGATIALNTGVRNLVSPKASDQKKDELNENSILVAFFWMIQGLVFSMVAISYEVINQTHVLLFGSMFSWLIVFLVAWEIVMFVNLVIVFRKLKLI